MTRVEDDDMIEALATDGADEPLDIGRLPGRARCDAHFINTEAAHTAPEWSAVDGIAVAQQVARRGVEGKRLDYLLCRPLGRGVFGDVEVHDLPPFMSQHEKDVENTKGGCGDGEEVNGHEVFDMIIEEGAPGL